MSVDIRETEPATARGIIRLFGGITALAKALGHQHITTVQGWNDRDNIPSRRQAEVLTAAKVLGIDLRPDHFFGAPLPLTGLDNAGVRVAIQPARAVIAGCAVAAGE